MSRNRKDFKTFYRFDGNGRIIPGSNILKKGYAPEEGTWKQADAYECCLPELTQKYWISSKPVPDYDSEVYSSTKNTDTEGNVYRLEKTIASGTDNTYFITKLDTNGVTLWEKSLTIDRDDFVQTYGSLAVGSNVVYLYVYIPTNNYFKLFKFSQADGSVLDQSPFYSPEVGLASYSFLWVVNSFVDSNDNFTALIEGEDTTTGNYTLLMVRHNSDDISNNVTPFRVESTDIPIDGYYGFYMNGQSLQDDFMLIGANGDFTGFVNYGVVAGLVRLTSSGVPAVDQVTSPFRIGDNETLLSGIEGEARSIVRDGDGNYYITFYNQVIMKLNSTADAYLWANQVISLAAPLTPIQGVVDSSNNLYVLYDYRENLNFPPPPDSALIAKITTTGDLDWAYRIYWTDYAVSAIGLDYSFLPVVSIENDTIYIGTPVSYTAKLPVNEVVVPGVYDTYTVEDVTAQFSGWYSSLDTVANPFSAPASNISLTAGGISIPVIQPPAITVNTSERVLTTVKLPTQTP